jgi:predicted transcriptional regulator
MGELRIEVELRSEVGSRYVSNNMMKSAEVVLELIPWELLTT